uniref:GST N-terminal domain-containing protein n=1 Tax=Bursaphelenchus xylophilus TaxID=6326 RepID=A0A1I7SJI4_BURXY
DPNSYNDELRHNFRLDPPYFYWKTNIFYIILGFPYGVMPVLRINNTVIAETAVVTRYIARIVNLNHYADLMDSARLDEIYTLGIEFVDMIHRYLTISLRDGKQATVSGKV